MLRSEGPLAQPETEADRTAGGRSDDAIVTWLQNPWLLLLLVVAGAAPLVWPPIPPLIDLGGHLGRFAIQLDAGQTASLRQWYSFAWDLIPNLGTDLLVQVLAPLMGLEPALKLIVTGIVVLQVAGYILLARAAHGHFPPTAFFALPLAYSIPFQYGFLNFTLSIALGTCALALWMVLGSRNRVVVRWLIFVPIACILWVTHLAGWAVFCVLAGADEIMRHQAKVRNLLRAGLRCVMPLSCLLAPWLIKLLLPSQSGGHGVTAEFFNMPNKLAYVTHVLHDRWAAWDLVSVALIMALLYWAWRSGRFRSHPGLALGAAIMFGLYLTMPGTIMGSQFADMRLLPTVLAIALISLSPRDGTAGNVVTALAIAGLLFAGARFAGNGLSLALSGQQASQELSVLDAVPRNTNLVSFLARPCTKQEPWLLERRSHFAGFAVARRHAFANDQWTIQGGQLLQVHNREAEPFDGDPSQFAYETACKGKPAIKQTVAQVPAAIDYLWIVGSGRPLSFDGWNEVRRLGGSAVYRRSANGAATTSARE